MKPVTVYPLAGLVQSERGRVRLICSTRLPSAARTVVPFARYPIDRETLSEATLLLHAALSARSASKTANANHRTASRMALPCPERWCSSAIHDPVETVRETLKLWAPIS